MIKHYITSILFILVLHSVACGQTSIEVNELSPITLVKGENIAVFEDESKQMQFEQVIGKKFAPADFNVPNFGFKNSSFWFKFSVQNTSHKLRNYIIEVKNPNLDVVELIAITSTNDTIKQTLGDYFPFEKRTINNKFFDFKHSFLPGETIQFYLNVQNSGEQFHCPFYVGNADDFVTSDKNEQIIFGIYFGIIIFVVLLNLFFYLVLKDQSTFYYILYLIGLLFLQLSLTGIGFHYIWPNSVFLANHANPIFANFSIFFLLHFSLQFLKIQEYLPRLAKFYRILSYIVVTGTIAALIDHQACYIYAVLSINFIALTLNIFIIPTSIHIYRKGYKPARFFSIAFIVLILSVFLFVFKNFGLLPPGWLTEYGLQVGSAMEVLLLTLAVIDRFRQFKDEALKNLEEVNQLKTESNIQLERKVEERTAEIQKQKIEIEEKNDEILGSIRYAKRIQEAILPEDALLINKKLDYFILYQPRDIVSGDFYWFQQPNETNEDEILLAVADCTGHGVPGAFMSILGMNYLKQSLQEIDAAKPSEILDYVNKNVIATLNQSQSESKVRDGMDISLIHYNKKSKSLQFAAANNPMYLVRKGMLIEIKADKQAIGSVSEDVKKYTNHIVEIQSGDIIYLFTDGYADQFGGPSGKKLKYSRLKEILVDISNENMNVQKEKLKQTFDQWVHFRNEDGSRIEYEQTDDVCIIGLRVS